MNRIVIVVLLLLSYNAQAKIKLLQAKIYLKNGEFKDELIKPEQLQANSSEINVYEKDYKSKGVLSSSQIDSLITQQEKYVVKKKLLNLSSASDPSTRKLEVYHDDKGYTFYKSYGDYPTQLLSINQNEKLFFFIERNDTLELLVYKKYVTYHDNTKIFAENKSYIEQLRKSFQSTCITDRKLMNTRYKESEIVALYQLYLECLGFSSSSKKTEKKKFLSVNIDGGVIQQKTNFQKNINFNNGINLGSSTSPLFGFTINLELNNKYTLHVFSRYTRTKGNGSERMIIGTRNEIVYEVDVDLSRYLMGLGISRNLFSNNKNEVFVKFGGNVSWLNGRTNSLVKTQYFLDEVTVTNLSAFDTNRLFGSVFFNLGWRRNRYEASFQYETFSSSFNSLAIVANNRSYGIILSYRIIDKTK